LGGYALRLGGYARHLGKYALRVGKYALRVAYGRPYAIAGSVCFSKRAGVTPARNAPFRSVGAFGDALRRGNAYNHLKVFIKVANIEIAAALCGIFYQIFAASQQLFRLSDTQVHHVPVHGKAGFPFK
jgi:hypothetical protein